MMSAVKNTQAARCPYYMTTLTQHGNDNPDYASLPLRDDAEIKRIANQIEHTSNAKRKESLQKETGINGEVSPPVSSIAAGEV
jgi:hypothetical protein